MRSTTTRDKLELLRVEITTFFNFPSNNSKYKQFEGKISWYIVAKIQLEDRRLNHPRLNKAKIISIEEKSYYFYPNLSQDTIYWAEKSLFLFIIPPIMESYGRRRMVSSTWLWFPRPSQLQILPSHETAVCQWTPIYSWAVGRKPDNLSSWNSTRYKTT